eukprot:Gb_29394 [translate_table: standard]
MTMAMQYSPWICNKRCIEEGIGIGRRRVRMPVIAYAIKPSILPQTDDKEKVSDFNGSARMTSSSPSSRVFQYPNTVGIIGGASALSTVDFMRKTLERDESIPLLVCSDPQMKREFSLSLGGIELESSRKGASWDQTSALAALREKRVFLEMSGACCVVMPCHISHAWYEQLSQGCSVPFLHMGDCVATELKEANLRPIETGSNLKIGLLGTVATLGAGVYQEKLKNQGFEVVLPDKATMEHVVVPAIEALQRNDIEGARNLLRIALQILLVSAVNTVVLASHDMLTLLTPDDPLLKKCIDPIDALARATVKWSHSARNIT